jgi:hypothetical protein
MKINVRSCGGCPLYLNKYCNHPVNPAGFVTNEARIGVVHSCCPLRKKKLVLIAEEDDEFKD